MAGEGRQAGGDHRKKERRPRGARPAEYHHGDLRRALVDATLALIERGGTGGVTLRAVARAAGVSHMAPYNHFADKAALIAAAGAEGFRRLKQAMERRMAAFAAGDPQRLQAVGIAYVVFAVENPELFRLMFGPELADTSSHEELAQAAHAVFETLLGALGGSGMGGPDAEAAARFAVAPWAMVHGLAMLAVARQVPGGGVEQAEAMAREATYLLYVGLKNAPGGPPR